MQLILRGKDKDGLEMVERALPFPSILGRLCSAQCEDACHRKKETGQAVAIKSLKRYLVEACRKEDWTPPEKAPATGKTHRGGGSRPGRHAGRL